MKLWIGRHAFAGRYSTDPKTERERPLQAEGIKIAKAIGDAMVAADEVPSVIFASPFTRATQTADIYGKAFGAGVSVMDDLSPDRPLEDRILELMAHGQVKRLMIVGHVDNLPDAMNNLGGDVNFDDLVMAEVRRVRIDRKDGGWKLRWGLKPSDLGMTDYGT